VVAMGALKRLSAHEAEITRMRVHPEHQRRGHGRAILTALEARARELGYTLLRLETTARQVGAQRLYGSHGYRRARLYEWERFEVWVYEKELGGER